MTPFESRLQTSGMAALNGQLGVSATYTDPDGGAATACTVSLGPLDTREKENPTTGEVTQAYVRNVVVSTAEVASVVVGGVFTMDALGWAVSRIVAANDAVVVAEVERGMKRNARIR